MKQILTKSENFNTSQYWDKWYRNRENDKKWYKGRRIDTYRFALEHISAKVPHQILEIGCGYGAGLSTIMKERKSNWQVSGIDFSPVARDRRLFPIACMDIERKLKDAGKLPPHFYHYFDIVLCVQTLEHFNNPKAIIKLLQDITMKEVVITVPYLDRVNSKDHSYQFSKRDFRKWDSVEEFEKGKKLKCVWTLK